MTVHKLLIASDLHYSANLQAEIDAIHHRLPPDTYGHRIDGRLFWHNELLVEKMGVMLDALLELAAREQPDLVIFLGDLVNTNWQENVADVVRRLGEFTCPVEVITGNHDIYLAGPESRLQEVTSSDAYETGFRHRRVGGYGLLFLDLFVGYDGGSYAKWLDIHADTQGVDYRPQDVEAARSHLAEHAGLPHLLFGHFPMCAPDPRIARAGRRMGRDWPGGRPLLERLLEPSNLVGIVAGHQHFAHFQALEHGFHWTLPALVEYPCAAAILELGEQKAQGRLVVPKAMLAQRSLRARQQDWPLGVADDQAFVWPSRAGER